MRHAPHLFIHDGATDAEIGQARARMTSFLDESPPEDPTAQRILGPIPPERRLVVTKAASFRLEDGSMVAVREGDVVDARGAWVVKMRRRRRSLFRKPTKPEVG